MSVLIFLSAFIGSTLFFGSGESTPKEPIYLPNINSQNVLCRTELSEKYSGDKNKCLREEFDFKEVTDKPIRIAVVDTGIDNTHYYLNSYISSKGYDFGEDTNPHPFKDEIFHGTHIAGIIIETIEELSDMTKTIVPFEIINVKYTSTEKSTQNNLSYALSNTLFLENVDIINISSNGELPSGQEFYLLSVAKEYGIQVVTVSGNEAADLSKKTSYPCNYPLDNIICVGAIDKENELYKASSYKGGVDIGAVGKDVLSTLPDQTWGYNSGTSMAAPRITGALAYYKAISGVSYLKRNKIGIMGDFSHKKFKAGNFDIQKLTGYLK